MSFRAGSVWEDVREIPKYLNLVWSKGHISGSLKDIQKENDIQPQVLKSKIAHDFITLSNFKEHESLWKQYLIDDVLGLADVTLKHGYSNQ